MDGSNEVKESGVQWNGGTGINVFGAYVCYP